MWIAPNGHFLGQIPHPMQRRSEIKAILESGATSMQSLPVRTTGQDFLHSWRHFYRHQHRVEGLSLVVKNTFGLHCRKQTVSDIWFKRGRRSSTDLVTVDNGNSNARVRSVARVNRKQIENYLVSLSAMVFAGYVPGSL